MYYLGTYYPGITVLEGCWLACQGDTRAFDPQVHFLSVLPNILYECPSPIESTLKPAFKVYVLSKEN